MAVANAQVRTLEGTRDTGKDGALDLRMVPLQRRENNGPLSSTQSPLMLTPNHKQGPLITKWDKAGLQATSEGYTPHGSPAQQAGTLLTPILTCAVKSMSGCRDLRWSLCPGCPAAVRVVHPSSWEYLQRKESAITSVRKAGEERPVTVSPNNRLTSRTPARAFLITTPLREIVPILPYIRHFRH